jgi:tetratricopeptide (TPR) repeat protein
MLSLKKRSASFETTKLPIVGDWLQYHWRTLVMYSGIALLGVMCVLGIVLYRGYQNNQGLRFLQEGIFLLQQGKGEEATALLEGAIGRLRKGEPRTLALFFLGKSLSKQQKQEEEKQIYREIATRAETTNYVKQFALMGLAQAAEKDQEFSQAQQLYKEAAAIEGPAQGLALLAEARILEQMDDKNTAQLLYSKFLEEYTDSPLIEIIQQKLNN